MNKRSNSKGGSRTHKYTTLLDKELSFQATEAFKTLRTNLMFALAPKKKKCFAVSSAVMHEGKSTMTANLAITFAQMQARVLLIDADLRKPVQHRLFKLQNKEGLSTLLSGFNSFKEVVNEDIIPGLDVITCGPIPPNPSEMLGSENMHKLIEELESYYDYVIIDTPPINVVTDALTLTNSVAGIVLVAMSGVSIYDSFQEAIDAIKLANGTILGTVITKVPVSTGKYGRYGKYGKYSKYSNKYGYKYGYSYGYGYRYNQDQQDGEDQ